MNRSDNRPSQPAKIGRPRTQKTDRLPLVSPLLATRLALNIDEFLQATTISRSCLYELWAEGTGPKIVKIGRRKLIPVDAAKHWLANLADPTSPSTGA